MRSLYRTTPLDEVEVDHLVMQFYRAGAITAAQIPRILAAYERGSGSAACLFNAAVHVAGESEQIRSIIDGFCEDRITILN